MPILNAPSIECLIEEGNVCNSAAFSILLEVIKNPFAY